MLHVSGYKTYWIPNELLESIKKNGGSVAPFDTDLNRLMNVKAAKATAYNA